MTPSSPEIEWYLCGECLSASPSQYWGGTDSTAICPVCRFKHQDDESSVVEAGSFAEMQQKKREWEAVA